MFRKNDLIKFVFIKYVDPSSSLIPHSGGRKTTSQDHGLERKLPLSDTTSLKEHDRKGGRHQMQTTVKKDSLTGADICGGQTQ